MYILIDQQRFFLTVIEMDEHLLILLFCSDLVVLHFSAAWAPQCKQMNDVMEELSKDSQYANVKFAQVTICLLLNAN